MTNGGFGLVLDGSEVSTDVVGSRFLPQVAKRIVGFKFTKLLCA